MEEGQERDSSSDEQRHIIGDGDMEDSPTDSPDLWMSERNEADTMFERALRDVIPSKRHPPTVSELSIVEQRKKLFKDLVKGGNETLTLSVGDQYLRDVVRPMTWKKNTVTFPNGKEWANKQKWLTAPDPQGHEDTVRYLTYGCAFRLVDDVDKKFQTYLKKSRQFNGQRKKENGQKNLFPSTLELKRLFHELARGSDDN
jgi:hypothetical protein